MINKLKQLREETGISMMDCKKALEETKGDIEKAKKILREKGKETLKDGCARGLAGIITSYIHTGGRIGVLLELHSQTDFVAKSDEFNSLAREICLQITATNPLFIREEDITEKLLDGERKIYQKQMQDTDKPEKIVKQILEGKISKYKKEISLLSQPWVKDSTKTISDLIVDSTAKIGEKIEIGNFTRYEI